jgi:hypothetical protein
MVSPSASSATLSLDSNDDGESLAKVDAESGRRSPCSACDDFFVGYPFQTNTLVSGTEIPSPLR